MLNKWIGIAIDSTTPEMIDLCEDHTNDLYVSFIECVTEIKNINPELSTITDKLENLFLVKTHEDVSFIYPNAIAKGIEIGKSIR